MKKRLIALFLAVAMLVSSVPVNAFAVETTEEPTVDTSEMRINGTNDFGTLLSDKLDAEETDEQENAGYSVTFTERM
jgi:hypothetical protein